MGYYRCKKRPSEYRFLKGLYPSAVALVLIYFLDSMEQIPCVLKTFTPDPATCRVEMPQFLIWGLIALFAYGIAAAGYRYYRDFHLGEYWLDLES